MEKLNTTEIQANTIEIGSAIKARLKECKLSVVWFAAQMGCSRTNIYKIFDKQAINTDDLFKISQILKFDFFKLYSNALEGMR